MEAGERLERKGGGLESFRLVRAVSPKCHWEGGFTECAAKVMCGECGEPVAALFDKHTTLTSSASSNKPQERPLLYFSSLPMITYPPGRGKAATRTHKRITREAFRRRLFAAENCSARARRTRDPGGTQECNTCEHKVRGKESLRRSGWHFPPGLRQTRWRVPSSSPNARETFLRLPDTAGRRSNCITLFCRSLGFLGCLPIVFPGLSLS